MRRKDADAIDSFIKQTDTAADWARDASIIKDKDDKAMELKANAIGLSGLARSRSMAYSVKAKSLPDYEMAADRLEEAVKLEPKVIENVDNTWIHRFWAAYSMWTILKDGKPPAAQARMLHARATKLATEADDRKTPPPVKDNKESLTGLLQALRDAKP
jgi:hypothetical protein